MENKVEKEWNEFWKEIVCNKDGSINLEQLKKELSDFSFLLEQVSEVYNHITDGLLSEVGYTAEKVINVVNEQQKKLIDKEMAKDDLLIILDGEISEESRQKLIDYFLD